MAIDGVGAEECLLVSEAKCRSNIVVPMAKLTYISSTTFFLSLLVAPEYVLTAAHCVGVFNKFEIGALCNDNDNCGQFSETIAMHGDAISHPGYDDNSL
jgi:hypothetical protein